MFTPDIYGSWKPAQEEKYKAIVARFPGFFSGLVLDIGGGPGYLEEFLQRIGTKAEIICTDIRKPSGVIADGNKLPFKDGSFDSVISIDAMHLIKEKDFARVVKPGGLVLFGLFFNKQNYEERVRALKDKLDGFAVVGEFELHGKESECFVLAKKPTSSPAHQFREA